MSQYCIIDKENKHAQVRVPVTYFSLLKMNVRLDYTVVTCRTVFFIKFVIS
jgi:hypothetical protein